TVRTSASSHGRTASRGLAASSGTALGGSVWLVSTTPAAAGSLDAAGSVSTSSTSQSRHPLKPSRNSSRQLGQNTSASGAGRVEHQPESIGGNGEDQGRGAPRLPIEEAADEDADGSCHAERRPCELLKRQARQDAQHTAARERLHLGDHISAEDEPV